MAGGLSSLVALVLSSSVMLVGGQTSCSLSGTSYLYILHVGSDDEPGKFYLPDLIAHAGAQFSLSSFPLSAEIVGGSIPGVRVTWRTTVPPECVASVTVEFQTSSCGPAVVTYTTTNTSQTELIQTGLQCATNYYIRVIVTGETSDGLHLTLSSRQVQVLVGGREIVCMTFDNTTVDLEIFVVKIFSWFA